MASLKSGVLVRLLEETKMAENAIIEDRKPSLLQIRSIMPVLEEGNLLPNRGFYLKISDASHAIYVTLPQDQNELILGNKLKLGQFIYVQKLEDAEPFPLLKDFTPLPGRRSCDGTPQEIGSVPNLEKVHDGSNSDFIVEKGVISEENILDISSCLQRLSLESSDGEEVKKKSSTNVFEGSTPKGKFRSLSASKARPGIKRCDVESRNYDSLRVVGRSRRMSVDNDSDTDNTVSFLSSSTWTSKRKSWNELKSFGVDEIFDSSGVKHNIRPPRCRSATVSPVRSVKYDSSDDNSSLISRRRVADSAKKIVKSSTKSKNCMPKIHCEQAIHPIKGLVYDRQGAETGISRDSLPSSLVELGKEVVKQRDVALFAASEALQEACVAERLLNSLSKFSEFRLPEEDDLQARVDTFLDLQDDMAQTRLIVKSLTNMCPTRTEETDSSSTNADNEAAAIAVQRKKNAATWIKSAVALDLSPCSTAQNPIASTRSIANTLKKSSIPSHGTKQKGADIIKTDHNRNTDDISDLVLPCNIDAQPEWTKGSTIDAATHLASSLQDECRKKFLGHIETYVNELERKMSLMVSDNQVAAMMYKIKRVNDWLDMMINKEVNESKEGSNLEESEIEACHRVRNKIYGMLLKHVERTAMAFESSKMLRYIVDN
ncbi:hypothetical protein P3S68_009728 [Capsicum galapagoense]